MLSSSMAEQTAVNRQVGGSTPLLADFFINKGDEDESIRPKNKNIKSCISRI